MSSGIRMSRCAYSPNAGRSKRSGSNGSWCDRSRMNIACISRDAEQPCSALLTYRNRVNILNRGNRHRSRGLPSNRDALGDALGRSGTGWMRASPRFCHPRSRRQREDPAAVGHRWAMESLAPVERLKARPKDIGGWLDFSACPGAGVRLKPCRTIKRPLRRRHSANWRF